MHPQYPLGLVTATLPAMPPHAAHALEAGLARAYKTTFSLDTRDPHRSHTAPVRVAACVPLPDNRHGWMESCADLVAHGGSELAMGVFSISQPALFASSYMRSLWANRPNPYAWEEDEDDQQWDISVITTPSGCWIEVDATNGRTLFHRTIAAEKAIKTGDAGPIAMAISQLPLPSITTLVLPEATTAHARLHQHHQAQALFDEVVLLATTTLTGSLAPFTLRRLAPYLRAHTPQEIAAAPRW